MDEEVSIQSDYDLAIQLACGEDDAFRTLIREHGPPVRGFLQKRFPRIADDAWQEALIRVWQKIDQYDPQKPLGTWFLKLAHRCALSIIRAEKQYECDGIYDDIHEDRRRPPDEPKSKKRPKQLERRAEQIREVVKSLPPKEQRVIEADLTFWKGKTLPSEVAPARRLAENWGDTNANAIHQARARARKKLREDLTRRGVYRKDSQS